MIHLWAPTFDDVYVVRDGDPNFHDTAAYWAATEWLPKAIGSIIVPTLVTFLAFYEYIVHFPTELAIWWRLCHRKRIKRGVMPLAILGLRYSTLALGVILAVSYWNPNQTVHRCTHVIWPLHFALVTVVSMWTACVNAWRSRTITRAAIQSNAYFHLVQSICVLFLLARLAALITAASFHRLIIGYQPLARVTSTMAGPHATCLSFSLAIAQKIKLQPQWMQHPSLLKPVYACVGMIVALAVSDLAFALVTLISIFRLSRNISAQSSLIASLFNNSIMFYSLLVFLDLIGVAFYVSTTDSDMIGLLAVIGSVLTVRVLINEQESIMAASRHTHTHWSCWLTATRDRAAAAPADRSFWNHNAGRFGALSTDAAHARKSPLISRLARLTEKQDDACDILHRVRGPLSGHADGHRLYGKHAHRRGTGMTDIERVTVLEHGRSVDRPWPQWDDEDDEDGEEEAGAYPGRRRNSSWQRRRIAGERTGIHTLIREWWRGVECAEPTTPTAAGMPTHDGGPGFTDDAGEYHEELGSRAMGRVTRLRTPTSDAIARPTRTSSRVQPPLDDGVDEDHDDEKGSIGMDSSSALDQQYNRCLSSANDTNSADAMYTVPEPPTAYRADFVERASSANPAQRLMPHASAGDQTRFARTIS